MYKVPDTETTDWEKIPDRGTINSNENRTVFSTTGKHKNRFPDTSDDRVFLTQQQRNSNRFLTQEQTLRTGPCQGNSRMRTGS